MGGIETGLLVDRRQGVANLTLNHPERANALDPAEFHALATLLGNLAGESGLIAIVLTGQGTRAFCAGLNLRNEAAIRKDLASDGPTGLGAALRAATRLRVPIIARVNGACVAGGMGLLGACDYVIAVSTARFALPEINHGIYPHVAMAALHDRGDTGVVRHMADTGIMLDADKALMSGLVDEVVPEAGLDDAVAGAIEAIRSRTLLAGHKARRDADPSSTDRRLDQAEALARQGTIKSSTVDS